MLVAVREQPDCCFESTASATIREAVALQAYVYHVLHLLELSDLCLFALFFSSREIFQFYIT